MSFFMTALGWYGFPWNPAPFPRASVTPWQSCTKVSATIRIRLPQGSVTHLGHPLAGQRVKAVLNRNVTAPNVGVAWLSSPGRIYRTWLRTCWPA